MKNRQEISKKQLRNYIRELIALARSLTSNVQSNVQIPGYEDQHAWLELYVPAEFDDQVDELVTERAHDIFIETGYDIGVIVYDKSQMQHDIVEA